MSETTDIVPFPAPPKSFHRNAYGLLDHVTYEYDEFGRINWRKMVKPEHLYINTERTQETDITKVNNEDLIIRLAGLHYLAKLRGFNGVISKIRVASPEYVCAECEIDWLPNYETDNQLVTTSATADAHLNNTRGFASYHLAAIAENRAFARAVRWFLGIEIVSDEEIGKTSAATETLITSATDNYKLLEAIMEQKGVDLEFIKDKLVKAGVENANTFESVRDIPASNLFELIDKLKKFKKAKAEQ